ncbi:MAG: exostosin family protein [Calothrix sp. SM1_7_51]|nr:exostosin family protein [Calothrix sp. SM1_7_51]
MRIARKKNDFSIPAWGEDIIKNNLDNQIPIRQKELTPTVGFCGFSAKNNFKTYTKSLLYEAEKLFQKKQDTPKYNPKYNIGHVLRRYGLNNLSKSPLVKTNFILSDKPFFNADDANSQALVRQQYINNILESDYIFCCRGYGNFSFRFYEALSCGRIPVFVNSNCTLPYDFEIDWKKYCVWVEEDEIHLIAEKVLEFHEQLSPQDFVSLQYECRQIWEQWLSPEGFFCNLYRHLDVIPKKLAIV